MIKNFPYDHDDYDKNIKYSLIIADDCLFRKVEYRDLIKSLVMIGKHSSMISIISTADESVIHHSARRDISKLFIHPKMNNINRIYKFYCNKLMKNNEKFINSIESMINEKFRYIVIDCDNKDYDDKNKILTYEARK